MMNGTFSSEPVTKRGFFKRIGALLAAATFPRVVNPAFWGPMSVQRHRDLKHRGIDLHIFQNGVDVTSRCRFFDDTPGRQRAELFLHRNGKPYLNPERTGLADGSDHGLHGERAAFVTQVTQLRWGAK